MVSSPRCGDSFIPVYVRTLTYLVFSSSFGSSVSSFFVLNKGRLFQRQIRCLGFSVQFFSWSPTKVQGPEGQYVTVGDFQMSLCGAIDARPSFVVCQHDRHAFRVFAFLFPPCSGTLLGVWRLTVKLNNCSSSLFSPCPQDSSVFAVVTGSPLALDPVSMSLEPNRVSVFCGTAKV